MQPAYRPQNSTCSSISICHESVFRNKLYPQRKRNDWFCYALPGLYQSGTTKSVTLRLSGQTIFGWFHQWLSYKRVCSIQ